jgi:proteasome lid subunit RPN8/RPN11
MKAEAKLISRYRLRLERLEAEPLRHLGGCYQHAGETAPILHAILQAEPFEAAGALFLDTHSRVTGYTVAYHGTLTRAAAEPRGLLLPALLVNASGLIVFHNHPNGDTTPSDQDIAMTWQLRDAARALGVRLWDHLILGDPPDYRSIFDTLRLSPVATPARLPHYRPSRKAKAKYRHPETGETWAGRGHMARWLREAIEGGATREDFRVRE